MTELARRAQLEVADLGALWRSNYDRPPEEFARGMDRLGGPVRGRVAGGGAPSGAATPGATPALGRFSFLARGFGAAWALGSGSTSSAEDAGPAGPGSSDASVDRLPDGALVSDGAALPGDGGSPFTPTGPAGSLDTSLGGCLLYTSPSPRDRPSSRMPSSA